MTESMQILVDLLTAAAALGAFGVGLWNAYQFGKNVPAWGAQRC